MRFLDPGLALALSQWRASADTLERATADNIHFEERVSAERQKAFENGATTPPVDLQKRHADYVSNNVYVDAEVPDTFDTTLRPADMGPIDQTQHIVRIEDLSRVLSQ
jgi:hypothetical protein